MAITRSAAKANPEKRPEVERASKPTGKQASSRKSATIPPCPVSQLRTTPESPVGRTARARSLFRDDFSTFHLRQRSLDTIDSRRLTDLDRALIKVIREIEALDSRTERFKKLHEFRVELKPRKRDSLARNTPPDCHAFLYWRFQEMLADSRVCQSPGPPEVNYTAISPELRDRWTNFLFRAAMVNAYGSVIRIKAEYPLEDPVKYHAMIGNSFVTVSRIHAVQRYGIRRGEEMAWWLATHHHDKATAAARIFGVYEETLLGVTHFKLSPFNLEQSFPLRLARCHAQEAILMANSLAGNCKLSINVEDDARIDDEVTRFGPLLRELYSYFTQGVPSLESITDQHPGYPDAAMATFAKLVREAVGTAEPIKSLQIFDTDSSSIEQSIRPDKDSRGNNVSPFNRFMVYFPSSSSLAPERNPFYEPLPGKEVWHRSVPPIFPFAETPFVQKSMSQRITADLLDDLMPETGNLSGPDFEPTDDAIATKAPIEGSSNTRSAARRWKGKGKESVNTSTAKSIFTYPPPWKLPDVTDEEVEQRLGGKRKERYRGRKRKRTSASDEDHGEQWAET